ncbi:uncharacterized protein JCM15063_004530 [Sporobolomyces koalae]|uniref:uncharacterized protein n=1 Tax=Sporobolomyces koalae TaxID=500713 RepID=UPI00317DA518
MAHLKSALRFPHPPPPTPPSPPPAHDLRSRFSAETLAAAKSPPGANPLQRFFSPSASTTSHSAPQSPVLERTCSTRSKPSPRASESFLSFASPKIYDSAIDPWGRKSLDALPEELGRTCLDAPVEPRAGGHIALGMDKLAEVAKEVAELIARKANAGKHARAESAGSAHSAIPGRPIKLVSPPRPTVDRFASAASNKNHRLIEVPPRSDSKGALTKPVATRQAGAPTPTPFPQGKHSKPTLRPNSPPSISIPPLFPQMRPIAKQSLEAEHSPLAPFKALLLSGPSRVDVASREFDELLVTIDVGGTIHTTTGRNLVGNKLGDFIAGAPTDHSAADCALLDKGSSYSRPMVPNSTKSASGHGTSPSSSPFPFMRCNNAGTDIDPDLATLQHDCSSPGDPLEPQSFFPMPTFALPPPPLGLELDPLPASRQVHVVPSPHLQFKHLSVHPSIVSSSPSSPLTPVARQGVSRKMSLPSSSRSFSYHDTVPSPNELAARRALAKRLHLSTGSLESKFPLDVTLEPFFEVLRDQAFESICPQTRRFSSNSTSSRSPENGEAQRNFSLPGTSLSEITPPNNVDPGFAARAEKSNHHFSEVFPSADLSEATPSLTSSESTAATDSAYSSKRTSTNVARISIFLDRTDTVLPSGFGSTYSVVFAFLRDGALPPHLFVPSNPHRAAKEPDATTLAILVTQPSLAFVQIAALRTVEKEARWLDIVPLVRACELERQRWVRALEMSTSSRQPVEVKGLRRRKESIMQERRLEGWI